MPASYAPYLPLHASITFHGPDAAHVAAEVMRSSHVRNALGWIHAAGYAIVGMELGAARRVRREWVRDSVVHRRPHQLVAQMRRREVNPVERVTVALECGTDDEPHARWQWRLNADGKLAPERIGI